MESITSIAQIILIIVVNTIKDDNNSVNNIPLNVQNRHRVKGRLDENNRIQSLAKLCKMRTSCVNKRPGLAES